MAQDGHHGHQGAAAGNGHGATPPATITNAPGSPCESTNLGTWTLSQVSSTEKNVDRRPGQPHRRRSIQKGNGSAADVVMAADVTEGDVTKGKGKAAADGATNAGNKAPPPHLMIERERRKRMKKMYDDLRSILPNVNEKTDRATMVTEAMGFIRHLEDTVQKLEKRKQELAFAQQAAAAAADLGAGSSSAPPDAAQVTTLSPVLPQGWGWLPKKKQEQPGAGAAAPPRRGFQTWSKANVVLNVCGDEAYICVCAPRRPGVLVMVLSVMEKHHIDVITAQVASDDAPSLFISIYTRVNVEKIKQLDAEAPESKDIYQLAVSEIIVWLSSY